MTDAPACSSLCNEPLPGTAKAVGVVVALEFLHGWGRDVLDGEALGEELAAAITAHLKPYKGSLQLIRKPGKAGQHRAKRRLYLIFPHLENPTIERYDVDGPADLLDFDLSGPGRNTTKNGGTIINHPLLLVCTHGKRDKCCAVNGRPVAAAIQSCFYGDEVWESSHTKGHRFAPSMLLFPWGYSYGRLNAHAATDVLKYAVRGEMFLPGNRGRGIYSAPCQVAEIVVANKLVAQGQAVTPGSLKVTGGIDKDNKNLAHATVTHPDGRAWTVTLETRQVEGVIASCGQEPKTGSAWVATHTEPVTN